MKPKRYIISGGGTGGNIYPAIAIADEIKRRNANADILFVGAKGRMEMEKVPNAGYQIEGLNISGFKRSLDWSNISLPVKVWMSLKKAGYIIKQFKPDMVIGTGGFAIGPVLFKACGYKIPTLIQEQNSFPGVTNKILAKRVDRICVAYDGMEEYFPKDKIVFSGNPVRNELFNVEDSKEVCRNYFGLDSNKITVLVVGGSLGAKGINESLGMNLNSLKEGNIQMLWQTGIPFFKESEKMAEGKGHIIVHEFIYEMGKAYKSADIIISRAGAIAISELCLIGKPAILIPFPHATGNHQFKNAKALADREAAILIEDKNAREDLMNKLLGLADDINKQHKLSKNINTLGKPNALTHIVNEIDQLLA